MNNTPYFLNSPSNKLADNLTTAILQLGDSASFHQSQPEYLPTPLIQLPALANSYGVANIYVKDESCRFGLNAFKGLGASYAVFKILQKYPQQTTFCTATDGNHGRAVAWSARRAGKEAVVFVPRDTTTSRIAAIENEGAYVMKIDGNYDEACAYAKQQSQEKGWQLVQDTAWEGYEEIPAYIMAGYITHFKELENSLHSLPKPKIDIVFLQAGVGSWAASATWYYLKRYGQHRPTIVVVEPTASDGILESFKQNRRSSPKGDLKTMMAGLNCGVPSLSAWDILKSGVDAAMVVNDSYAAQAMKLLYFPKEQDPQLFAGESGAGGLAGFLALMTDKNYAPLRKALNLSRHSSILFYNTEGATDPENFKKIING